MNANKLDAERRDFLGRGWSMPAALDPLPGPAATVAYEQDNRHSMLIILETSPGERVMRPNFGCGIHEQVFTAVDSTAIQRIKSLVEEAMRRCEARIEVLGVTVDEAATSEGELLIELEYRIRKTNQVGNLVFRSEERRG